MIFVMGHTIVSLRARLTQLCPSRADIERVLHDAGVDYTRFNLDGSINNAWFDALKAPRRRRS